jgi:hypothetical protein
MNDWRTIAALVLALSLILVGMDRAQGVITLLAERGVIQVEGSPGALEGLRVGDVIPGGGQTWE